MDKRKSWHKYLIFGTLLLTLYNILPTIFFYAKPLQSPIDAARADKIAEQITERVNGLEKETITWLGSLCNQLKISPQQMAVDPEQPQILRITFKNSDEANMFRRVISRAGTLIPFVPQQLNLSENGNNLGKTVTLLRKIPVHFADGDREQFFQYSKKFDETGLPTTLYRVLTYDRALQLSSAIAGPSENSRKLQSLLSAPTIGEKGELSLPLAQDILTAVRLFGENSDITRRFFSTFSHIESENRTKMIQNFISCLEQCKDQVKLDRIDLQSQAQTLKAQGNFLESSEQQALEQLSAKEETLSRALALVKKHQVTFASGTSPLHYAFLNAQLEEGFMHAQKAESKRQTLSFGSHNPFIQELSIDWGSETMELTLHSDIEQFKHQAEAKRQSRKKNQADQLIYNEIARNARISGESITPIGSSFQIKLNQIEGSDSFLAFRLSEIAKKRALSLSQSIKEQWHPKHLDLQVDQFPVWDYETFETLPAHEKKLGLVVYAPAMRSEMPKHSLKSSSIYVIAKGLDRILQKIQMASTGADHEQFIADFNDLKTLLRKNGFFGYPGSTLSTSKNLAGDFVFESEEYYLPVLKATREEFSARGTKRFAILELSNVQQRILTENKIDTRVHEDLLKWRDDYHAANAGLNGAHPHDVPKPTRNVLVSNLLLSAKKYIRGDERKILRWGLDLSGGKTVQVQLRDQSNRPVVDDVALKQGIEELYKRVNKMGVSEVSIRKEGNLITLDFPGSQELSASELIKSSSMYFHIVNEKFNQSNPSLATASSQFLQDIWNEAVITGRKTAEEINEIAWRHVHGESLDSQIVQPRSEAARVLYENGLRLANPHNMVKSNLFNDAHSEIAILRGDDFTEWKGQTHPLLIVFSNFAIEGANLKNVQAGYDPNKGNFLSFEIRGKETLKSGERINPREDLYAWTSQFSQDKIAGTPNALFSQNSGWRMAAILNGNVVTAPVLNQPIRDSGLIDGSFSMREVNQLEADLKAGSLSFTPHILSEKNVSPELGAKERTQGITATIVAIALVFLCMISYYRFGGAIASVAVIVNLLIMWATLQNIGATLTLASIAAIILTLGMAVDANVLVFERIREEFALSGRLASAVQAGYKKAFSAIVDSNITTIIAAVILLQFDSGPIKGFAITIIIGIVSSMFTALFMTRYFFSGWVQNPKHVKLNMSKLINATKFPFLKYGKFAILVSSVLILAGGFFFVQSRHTIMGMDFTGGYSLNMELKTRESGDYRSVVEKALIAHGASLQEFQVRQLSPNNHIRLFLSKALQQEGKPFFNMPLEQKTASSPYAFESNPRISWVVHALEDSGVALTADSLSTLDRNWSEVSGQLSDSMRNSALIGLGLAVLCILIYITIRFEFTYALSATLCLGHDIAITIASLALFHYLGLAVQIDLNTIAALMTIVGYSLNDTIIVFDRIREDLRLMKSASLSEIINHALNVTLSRTTMTSITTLLVLLPLVLMGGSTLFAFTLVMIVGVVFGTLSSLFIAAPMLRFFQVRQTGKEKTTAPVVQ